MGEEKAVTPKGETAQRTGENDLVYTVCDGCCQWQLSCDAQATSIQLPACLMIRAAQGSKAVCLISIEKLIYQASMEGYDASMGA